MKTGSPPWWRAIRVEPPEDVRDRRAEDPAVDVQLVDHDVAQPPEELHPARVVRQDPDVEHVGVRDEDVAAIARRAGARREACRRRRCATGCRRRAPPKDRGARRPGPARAPSSERGRAPRAACRAGLARAEHARQDRAGCSRGSCPTRSASRASVCRPARRVRARERLVRIEPRTPRASRTARRRAGTSSGNGRNDPADPGVVRHAATCGAELRIGTQELEKRVEAHPDPGYQPGGTASPARERARRDRERSGDRIVDDGAEPRRRISGERGPRASAREHLGRVRAPRPPDARTTNPGPEARRARGVADEVRRARAPRGQDERGAGVAAAGRRPRPRAPESRAARRLPAARRRRPAATASRADPMAAARVPAIRPEAAGAADPSARVPRERDRARAADQRHARRDGRAEGRLEHELGVAHENAEPGVREARSLERLRTISRDAGWETPDRPTHAASGRAIRPFRRIACAARTSSATRRSRLRSGDAWFGFEPVAPGARHGSRADPQARLGPASAAVDPQNHRSPSVTSSLCAESDVPSWMVKRTLSTPLETSHAHRRPGPALPRLRPSGCNYDHAALGKQKFEARDWQGAIEELTWAVERESGRHRVALPPGAGARQIRDHPVRRQGAVPGVPQDRGVAEARRRKDLITLLLLEKAFDEAEAVAAEEIAAAPEDPDWLELRGLVTLKRAETEHTAFVAELQTMVGLRRRGLGGATHRQGPQPSRAGGLRRPGRHHDRGT